MIEVAYISINLLAQKCTQLVSSPGQRLVAADVPVLLMVVHKIYDAHGLSWYVVHIQDHKIPLTDLKFSGDWA